MVPSNGMCMGVTPSGVEGSTRPSMRSATACAMTLAASVAVPVGRCGPCCSTLPAGRITSGFFLSWAAISGCVRSQKLRLSSIAAPLGDASARRFHDLGDAHQLAVVLDRAQRRVLDRHRRIAIIGGELVLLPGAAALSEQFELGAEHVAFRHAELLPLGVAVLPALHVER